MFYFRSRLFINRLFQPELFDGGGIEAIHPIYTLEWNTNKGRRDWDTYRVRRDWDTQQGG